VLQGRQQGFTAGGSAKGREKNNSAVPPTSRCALTTGTAPGIHDFPVRYALLTGSTTHRGASETSRSGYERSVRCTVEENQCTRTSSGDGAVVFAFVMGQRPRHRIAELRCTAPKSQDAARIQSEPDQREHDYMPLTTGPESLLPTIQ
jgi:hypothetical protein